jgi:hypothetical protein
MSKQLKYRLKKTLKKAEFVHADLEYHQALLPEAKRLFSEEILKALETLSPEEQDMITKIREKTAQEQQEAAIKAAAQTEDAHDLSDDHDKEETTVNETDEPKKAELKKIFRQIAAQSHPDKQYVRDDSKAEIDRLEKIFKKATDAYNNENWYTLYSLALTLGIPLDEASQSQIEWVEEDIRYTLAEISKIGAVLAWVWYSGDPTIKQLAIKDYFKQVFNYDYPVSL